MIEAQGLVETESLWGSPVRTRALEELLKLCLEEKGREKNTIASAFLLLSNYLPVASILKTQKPENIVCMIQPSRIRLRNRAGGTQAQPGMGNELHKYDFLANVGKCYYD